MVGESTTSPGGSPTGASGFSGSGGPQTSPAHAAPSGGGNGLAAEVHTLERAIFEVKRIIVGQDQALQKSADTLKQALARIS